MLILALLLACTPLDGLLPAGTWGAESWSLVVDADGSAVLETDCAHGVIEHLEAVDGEVDVAVAWTPEGGPTPEDPPPPEGVTLTGSATATRLVGTVSHDDGDWEREIDVKLDVEPVLYKCQ